MACVIVSKIENEQPWLPTHSECGIPWLYHEMPDLGRIDPNSHTKCPRCVEERGEDRCVCHMPRDGGCTGHSMESRGN